MAKKELEIPKPVATEDIEPGSPVIIETMRLNGASTIHLGRFLGATLHEVIVDHYTWVKQTGRRYKFMAGDPDSNAHWEVNPPLEQQRLPRWMSWVGNYHGKLPTKSQ